MEESKPQQVPMVTLTPEAAHNAVVTLVQMYGGMMADKDRAMQLLKVQLAAAQQEAAALRAKLAAYSDAKAAEVPPKSEGLIRR